MKPKPRFQPLHLCFALVPFLISAYARADRIIYVNQSAAGTNDGTSWTDAFLDLHDALDEAAIECIDVPCEIWVAAGTYKPDRGTLDRSLSYTMMNNVALYGGFAGTEESREQRDWQANQTILQGDLLENDDLSFISDSNCCSEHPGSGCDNESCEQRVCGALEHCCMSNFWNLIDCDAIAQQLCCDLCRPTRCDNSEHLLTAFLVDESAILDGFVITGGEANDYLSNEFSQFGGPNRGGGLWVVGGPQLSVVSSPSIRNCTFRDNAATAGAAVYCRPCGAILDNCWVESNICFNGSGTAVALRDSNNVGMPSVYNSSFVHNSTGLELDGTGQVENCIFIDNRHGLSADEALVSGCTFIGNSPSGALSNSGQSQVINCTFVGNHAHYGGGGLNGPCSAVINCVFIGNSADAMGSAVQCEGNGFLFNNTFFANYDGGTAVWTGTIAHLENNILWGNVGNETFSLERQQVFASSGVPLTLKYNSIEGWSGAMGGVGNVGLDPFFVDDAGPDGVVGTGDENLRLSSDSPLINLGHPDPPLAPYLDGDGHARILCGRIDIGAYEFGIGDYNCDRIIELADFASFPACLTGPAPNQPYSSDCAAYDFVTEVIEDVDLLDFAGLQNDR